MRMSGVEQEPKVSKEDVVVSLLRWRGETLQVDEPHIEMIGTSMAIVGYT